MIQLRIQPQVSLKYPGIPIALGVILKIQPKLDWELFSRLELQLRSQHSLEQLRDHPLIRAYREFFWRMGIDPTKHRPAAEALLRRLIARGSLPRIDPIVDGCNLASAQSLLTFSAFDLDKLDPPLMLRLASPGEQLQLIGNRKIALTGDELVLADSTKPICAYAHGDCELTKITQLTSNVLIAVYGAPGIAKHQVAQALELAANLLGTSYSWSGIWLT